MDWGDATIIDRLEEGFPGMQYQKVVTKKWLKNEKYKYDLCYLLSRTKRGSLDTMKLTMTNKLIYDTISEIIGEDVIPIVKYLRNRKNISEFKIAENTNLEVNTTRNMLYRLHDWNIVTYNRKKDRIKGWYISYWTFNLKRLKQVMVQKNKETLEKLKEKLEKEEMNKNSYFLCPNICTRLDFDQATEFGFKCPECGSLLNQQDNTKTIENLKNRVAELESGLK